MTDSAEASLELIIERIEGEYSNFSVSSRCRRQLMLGRKMFATFSEIDMSFKLGEGQLSQAYSIAGAETWNPKGREIRLGVGCWFPFPNRNTGCRWLWKRQST
jgi:hypothetical protein